MKAFIFLILASVLVTGCTNVIPKVGILDPSKLFTPEDNNGRAFKSRITMSNGRFHADGDDSRLIQTAEITSEGGVAIPLSVQHTDTGAVLAPPADQSIPEGSYSLKITAADGQDLGKFTLEITGAQLTGEDIQDEAISGEKLAPNSVTASKIAPGSIDSTKLTADAIDPSKFPNSSINGSKIVAGSIDLTKLTAGLPDAVLVSGPTGATWNTTVIERLNTTVRFNGQAIGKNPDALQVGSVVLVGDDSGVYVNYPMTTVIGGTQNSAVAEGAVILGGQGNAVQGKGAAIIGGQNITTMNANEIALGGQRSTADNVGVWTSLIHLSAVESAASSTTLYGKLPDGDPIIKFAHGTAGSCQIDLTIIANTGNFGNGDGRVSFKVPVGGGTATVQNKSNTAFSFGVNQYNITGEPALNGFRVKILAEVGNIAMGQYIMRLTCLLSK